MRNSPEPDPRQGVEATGANTPQANAPCLRTGLEFFDKSELNTDRRETGQVQFFSIAEDFSDNETVFTLCGRIFQQAMLADGAKSPSSGTCLGRSARSCYHLATMQ